MRLPIRVARWEIECCVPDIIVGERWVAAPMLEPVTAVAVQSKSGDEPSGPVVLLEVNAEPVPAPAPGAHLVNVGALVVGVYAELKEAGPVKYEVWNDSHYEGPGADLEWYPPTVEGWVVELYGVESATEPSGREIVAERSLHPLTSTAIRHKRRSPDDREFEEFLAVLETDFEQG